MKELGILAGGSVSHHNAAVDTIESLSLSTGEAVELLLNQEGVEEAFALATCNRFEAYVVAESRETGQAALEPAFAEAPPATVAVMGHEESLRHLLRVAAGLESLVLGEDQILGQVREAYQTARDVGGVGPLLEDALTKAIRVGERARSETGVNDGIVSIGSAAVELSRRERELEDAVALVVGAGEMGALTATALSGAVDDLVVANRTAEEADRLANTIDARAIGLESIRSALGAADVVISATASEDHVLERPDLADAGETLVVDIGQPRDVAPGATEVEGVTVRDLDDLESVTAETHASRQEAAAAVEAIVDEELDRLLTQYKRRRADQVVAAMYEGAERVKEAELRTASSQLAAADTSSEREEVLESLADAIVGQLLAAPTSSLREAAEHDDWETIHTALKLFDPRLDVATEELPASMAEGIPPDVVDELTDD